jgi:hypothetical protein
MKRALLFAVMMMAATACSAQGFRAAFKESFTNKKFLLGVGAIVAVNIADAITTNQAQKACPLCPEQSLLLPVHPSAGRVWETQMGVAAAEVALHWLVHWAATPSETWYPNGALRVVGYLGVPTAVVAGESWAIHRNSLIVSECKSARLVCR